MTLEQRRNRIDLIQVYKIVNKIDNVAPTDYFEFCENSTRNHGYKLKVNRYNTSKLGNFFTYRVTQSWNKLPADIVNSISLSSFVAHLDNHSLKSSL